MYIYLINFHIVLLFWAVDVWGLFTSQITNEVSAFVQSEVENMLE